MPCAILPRYIGIVYYFLQRSTPRLYERSGKDFRWRKKSLILFIVLSSFFLFLLVPACFAAYYQFANPTTAQVQIQPEVKQLQNTTMLHVVTGSPDATKQQIAGARLLSATTQQTATGKGYTAATNASGEMSMEVLQINGQLSGFVTLFAGSVLTGTVTGGHDIFPPKIPAKAPEGSGTGLSSNGTLLLED
jgi:hypothetical protein